MDKHKLFIETMTGYLSWEAIVYLEDMGTDTLIVDAFGKSHRTTMSPMEIMDAANGRQFHVGV